MQIHPRNVHGSNKFLIAPLRLRVCLFSCWKTSERVGGGGVGGREGASERERDPGMGGQRIHTFHSSQSRVAGGAGG